MDHIRQRNTTVLPHNSPTRGGPACLPTDHIFQKVATTMNTGSREINQLDQSSGYAVIMVGRQWVGPKSVGTKSERTERRVTEKEREQTAGVTGNIGEAIRNDSCIRCSVEHGSPTGKSDPKVLLRACIYPRRADFLLSFFFVFFFSLDLGARIIWRTPHRTPNKCTAAFGLAPFPSGDP